MLLRLLDFPVFQKVFSALQRKDGRGFLALLESSTRIKIEDDIPFFVFTICFLHGLYTAHQSSLAVSVSLRSVLAAEFTLLPPWRGTPAYAKQRGETKEKTKKEKNENEQKKGSY